jgi:diketogulonate reductase-like aldo/keto reductase
MPAEELPPVGFGTYKLEDPDECVESVATALEVGYRHVDTAQGYDNEEYVGRAIGESDVPREDVFLATKVSTRNLAYDDVLATTEESLERLQVDAVDLLYVHWPLETYDPEGTLSALDELHEAGTVRNVGLSNFLPDQIADARERLDAPVFAHQVEMHPLLQQRQLHREAVENDSYLVAYSPIAKGEVFDVPELVEIAEKHDATPAQVSLAWLMGRDNVVPIPKASDPDHARENLAATELELDEEDRECIRSIDEERRMVDFDAAPWNQ